MQLYRLVLAIDLLALTAIALPLSEKSEFPPSLVAKEPHRLDDTQAGFQLVSVGQTSPSSDTEPDIEVLDVDEEYPIKDAPVDLHPHFSGSITQSRDAQPDLYRRQDEEKTGQRHDHSRRGGKHSGQGQRRPGNGRKHDAQDHSGNNRNDAGQRQRHGGQGGDQAHHSGNQAGHNRKHSDQPGTHPGQGGKQSGQGRKHQDQGGKHPGDGRKYEGNQKHHGNQQSDGDPKHHKGDPQGQKLQTADKGSAGGRDTFAIHVVNKCSDVKHVGIYGVNSAYTAVQKGRPATIAPGQTHVLRAPFQGTGLRMTAKAQWGKLSVFQAQSLFEFGYSQYAGQEGTSYDISLMQGAEIGMAVDVLDNGNGSGSCPSKKCVSPSNCPADQGWTDPHQSSLGSPADTTCYKGKTAFKVTPCPN